MYLGRFLFGSIPARMVQFTRRSPRFGVIMRDLLVGRQPYLSLKRRLLRNLNGSLYEIVLSLGLILRVVGDRVVFTPPLIIDEAEVDEMMARWRGALDDTWAEVRREAA